MANLFATSASLNAAVTQIYNATASLYAATASIYGATSSLFNYSASSNLRIGSLEQYTASLNTRSASFACVDSSNNFSCVQYFSNTSNAVSFSSTGSLYSDGGMRITKDLYVSGTSYFNNVTVFGTQSVAYISSSQLNIGTNIISVNTDTPSIRFGGLAVYDSGSTSLTGSILWDSEDNQWIYSNPSGSTYDSAVFLVGPRNVGVLGNEPGISCNFLSKGNGLHHMTSSGIFEDGTKTCFYGTTVIGSGGTISSPTIYGSTTVCGATICSSGNSYTANASIVGGCIGIGGTFNPTNPLHIYGDSNTCFAAMKVQNASACCLASVGIEFQLLTDFVDYKKAEIRAVAASQFANNIDLAFWSGGSSTDRHAERMRILSTGETCFACQICAPVFVGNTTGATYVCGTTLSATSEYRLNGNSYSRVATLDSGGGFGGGYNFNWCNGSPIHDSTGALVGYGYANDGSFRFYTNGGVAAGTAAPERLRINASGIANFACQVCAPAFVGGTVNGTTGIFTGRVTAGSSMLLGEIQSSNSLLETTSGNGIWLRPAGISSPCGVFINTTGQVGMGTASPQGALEVIGLSYFTRASNSLLINPNYGGANTHAQLQVVCNMALAFATNGDNERMRITNTGDARFNCSILVNNYITLCNPSACAALLLIQNPTNATANTGGEITFAATYRATADYTEIARIRGLRENATSGAWAGYLAFYTSPGNDTPSASTERLRITSTGIACFACQVCTPNLVVNGSTACVNINRTDGTPAILQLGNAQNSFQIQFTCTGGQRIAFINGAPSEFASFYGATGIACFLGTVCSVNGFRTGDNSYLTKSTIRLRSSNNNKYLDLQATDTCAIIASNFGDSDIPLILGSWGGYQNNQLFLSTNCNVGIWTNSPSYRLDVSGAARVGTLLVSNATTTTWCVGRVEPAITDCWKPFFGWNGIYDGAFAIIQLGYEDNNGDGANAHALYMTSGAAYSTGFTVTQIGGATNLCLRRNGQCLEVLVTGVGCRASGSYIGFTVQSMNVAS